MDVRCRFEGKEGERVCNDRFDTMILYLFLFLRSIGNIKKVYYFVWLYQSNIQT